MGHDKTDRVFEVKLLMARWKKKFGEGKFKFSQAVNSQRTTRTFSGGARISSYLIYPFFIPCFILFGTSFISCIPVRSVSDLSFIMRRCAVSGCFEKNEHKKLSLFSVPNVSNLYLYFFNFICFRFSRTQTFSNVGAPCLTTSQKRTLFASCIFSAMMF